MSLELTAIIALAVHGIRRRQDETKIDPSYLANVLDANEQDNLAINVEVMSDGSLFAEFADLGAPQCWDGCNGITRTHRGGWCRTNPSHGDRDCGCGEADYEDEPVLVTVGVAGESLDDLRARLGFSIAESDFEPF